MLGPQHLPRGQHDSRGTHVLNRLPPAGSGVFAAGLLPPPAEIPLDFIALRKLVLRRGLDLPNLLGMEIGPLADPVIAKSDGPVLYVDHADTEALRRKCAADPNFDISKIVDVDVVWQDRPLAHSLGGRLVDYAIASHVAEHVPDLITWLTEMRAALKPGGELRLVLPDKRFSFDALREETRLTDLLAAWVVRSKRPQIRDVLDFQLHYAPGIDAQGLYEGRMRLGDARPYYDYPHALRAAKMVLDHPDLYHDVHCWVFQARQFARLMWQIASHGLLPFACAGMADPSWPGFEFFVFMRACDDPAEIRRSWQEAFAVLRDPLPGAAEGARAAPLLSESALIATRQAIEAFRAAVESCAAAWRSTAAAAAATEAATADLRELLETLAGASDRK